MPGRGGMREREGMEGREKSMVPPVLVVAIGAMAEEDGVGDGSTGRDLLIFSFSPDVEVV